ncbi:hypothetical protein MMF93_07205 [Streptomyces tubbatahanensis]|uniref:Nucleopolyhedrovirus P10 family protein n=1 Tax=Streptomyces tubbatahanensis TaxID=2923272 RepID=A0ABY3XPH5_9ACTN|nr:hypothetical protein [Streptomyces tubbatahanensis]UNS96310.1 hypothetical protein MMF93_07205 [Streptomyces tubbatahanensis]
MPTEKLTQVVRQQLGLGRLLPLGRAADGVWVAEEAAVGVLLRPVLGGRLSGVRIDLAGPARTAEPAVPPPPSALRPGPLALTADLAVTGSRPVQDAADAVRATLLGAAERDLGLPLETVDLRVTEWLESAAGEETGAAGDSLRTVGSPGDSHGGEGGAHRGEGGAHDDAEHLARAVLAVDGVARLAPVVGPALSRVAAGPAPHAVDVTETGADRGRHVLVQLALSPTRRALDTARAAREAARAALADGGTSGGSGSGGEQATVAVLITAIDRA